MPRRLQYLYERLQILLRELYETVYGAFGGMGNVS